MAPSSTSSRRGQGESERGGRHERRAGHGRSDERERPSSEDGEEQRGRPRSEGDEEERERSGDGEEQRGRPRSGGDEDKGKKRGSSEESKSSERHGSFGAGFGQTFPMALAGVVIVLYFVWICYELGSHAHDGLGIVGGVFGAIVVGIFAAGAAMGMRAIGRRANSDD